MGRRWSTVKAASVFSADAVLSFRMQAHEWAMSNRMVLRLAVRAIITLAITEGRGRTTGGGSDCHNGVLCGTAHSVAPS